MRDGEMADVAGRDEPAASEGLPHDVFAICLLCLGE